MVFSQTLRRMQQSAFSGRSVVLPRNRCMIFIILWWPLNPTVILCTHRSSLRSYPKSPSLIDSILPPQEVRGRPASSVKPPRVDTTGGSICPSTVTFSGVTEELLPAEAQPFHYHSLSNPPQSKARAPYKESGLSNQDGPQHFILSGKPQSHSRKTEDSCS